MTARLRTGFSFRSAVGKIDEVIARLKELDTTYAPITDTASTFGWVKWAKATKKAELKPVFGVELAVTPSIHEKKPAVDFWTFIAKDSLVPINELISLATQQFRYQPLLTIEQALAQDDVFTIIGHRADFTAIQPREHLYFGLGPSITRGQVSRALDAGIAPVAVSDNRYPKEGQQGFYETVCGRNASTQSYPQWIMSDQEWRQAIPEIEEEASFAAHMNKLNIFEHSTASLQPAEMVHPERPKTLKQMCIEGAKLLGCDLKRKEYKDRLERELALIESKKFEDYFYLVGDICQWARERMIVGPARGSSCGSLVCYLLRITTIDPIPFGLIFERFIDVNRSDLPDIDIDFPENRREEVFNYVAEKYGRDKVARLGTVAMYQPRSALKETAGAMDIAPWLLEPVMDAIIERSSGDSRALQATEDTLKDTTVGREFLEKYPEIKVAMEMEGHPRHYSQHAAGIVITEHPVLNYVAVDQRTGATMCDKKDAEELNLLKIDALGLAQLSIFEDALDLAGLPRDHLFSVSLTDQASFDVLNKKQYAGIFQFNGLALQSITDQIDVRELNDIVAITALARPGPLNAGGTNRWIKTKTGRVNEEYKAEVLRPYLSETLGIITYQEQVMMICREIGGLSWGDVNALRRAMSKSLGVEFFDQYGDPVKAALIEKGVSVDAANDIWAELCSYGAMGFNKSHAVAYGLVSYWCCWLKAHYPLEFAAATMNYAKPEVQIKLLRELAKEGVEYLAADIDYSTDKWTVKKGGNWNHLVGPLSNVNGIGPKMMALIMQSRELNAPIPERARKLLVNPKTKIDSLYPVRDAFKRLLPDPKERNIVSTPVPISEVQVKGHDYEVLVFCVAENIKPKDENEEINVAKRGYRFNGPTDALNLRLADDTDVIFAKINRFDFKELGRPIVERGRAGKALYAIKGNVPKDFRMISVKQVKYIGDIEQ